MKRDISVELARILGSMIVIGVHCWAINFGTNTSKICNTILQCCFADGVAIFWLIAGFFMFGKFEYQHVMKRTLFHIIIPLVLVNLLVFYVLNDFFSGTPIHILSHSRDEYIEIKNCLLAWQNLLGERTEHLWYLYVYILLMILSPILNAFIHDIDGNTQKERAFLLISLAMLVWNDCSNNTFGNFQHHTFLAAIPAAVEMMWGYFIYKYKDKFARKVYMLYAIFGFIVLNSLRTWIQVSRTRFQGDGANYILFWYSSIGLLCAIMVVVFCFSAVGAGTSNSRFNHLICEIGSYTFTVYIVHPLVNSYLEKEGWRVALWNKVVAAVGNENIAKVLYMICIIAAVFFISLVIAVILRLVNSLLHRIFRRKKAMGEHAI